MEIELKFKLSSEEQGLGVLLDLVGKAQAQKIQKTNMHSIYYDTHDGLLAEQNLSLRVRRQGERSICNIKAQVADRVDVQLRDEWECEADTPEQGLEQMPDTGYEIFCGIKQKRYSLVPVADIEFIRHWADVSIGEDCMAEVCVDIGTMHKKDCDVPFAELEAELKQGYNIEAFIEFGQELALRYKLEVEPLSKLKRAYQATENMQQPK